MYRKEGRLYIIVDGSQVNTRIKDNNSSSWKEMKLELIFNDKDTIRTASENCIIAKKKYVPYFGSVSEFKKFVFLAAAKAVKFVEEKSYPNCQTAQLIFLFIF